MRIAVLGSGAVGQTFAKGLETHDYDVRIASRSPAKLAEFSNTTGISAVPFDAAASWCEGAVLAVRGSMAEEAVREAGPENLAGKLVIDVIVPLALRAGFFELVPVPGAASVGELIQWRVPNARVVSAFKNLSAEKLRDLGTRLAGDVVLCGDDAAARDEVAGLVRLLPGLRPVDAGGIANARYVEAITALLLNLNRRHAAQTSIAILGLD